MIYQYMILLVFAGSLQAMQSVFYFPGAHETINLKNCDITMYSSKEDIQYFIVPHRKKVTIFCTYIYNDNCCWINIMSGNSIHEMPYSKVFSDAAAEEFYNRRPIDRRKSL